MQADARVVIVESAGHVFCRGFDAFDPEPLPPGRIGRGDYLDGWRRRRAGGHRLGSEASGSQS